MPQDRNVVAVRVARKLAVAEHAIDTAMTAMGQLAAALPEARIAVGFAAQVGNSQLGDVVSALNGLHTVRTHVVNTHKYLNELRAEHGLVEIAQGDKTDTPYMLAPVTSISAAA